MLDLAETAGGLLERLRREQPLVHLITNFVTMSRVADAVHAVGGRPVMAFAGQEAEEIAVSARALVLNLGTPTQGRIESMLVAGQAANGRGIPVVFDPVGVGASKFRTTAASSLLASVKINVIRGNAGEIASLAGEAGTVSGVESAYDEDPARVARLVAGRWQTVVAVTGAADRVDDGRRAVLIHNGDACLQTLTGAGDIASALCGACLAVEPDAFVAASAALLCLGLAAERAAARAQGVGSFGIALLDELQGLDPGDISREAKVEEIK